MTHAERALRLFGRPTPAAVIAAVNARECAMLAADFRRRVMTTPGSVLRPTWEQMAEEFDARAAEWEAVV